MARKRKTVVDLITMERGKARPSALRLAELEYVAKTWPDAERCYGIVEQYMLASVAVHAIADKIDADALVSGGGLTSYGVLYGALYVEATVPFDGGHIKPRVYSALPVNLEEAIRLVNSTGEPFLEALRGTSQSSLAIEAEIAHFERMERAMARQS